MSTPLEDARVKKFLGHICLTLNAAGYSVELLHTQLVNNCSGYLCWDTRKLVVAAGAPFYRWLGVVAHEFSHFLQIQDAEAGVKSPWDGIGENDIWSWMDGSLYLSKAKLRETILATQIMESDADRRALKLIREYKLPIDIKLYCRQANAYHLFYNYIEKYGVWYDYQPYWVPEIMELMPTRLIKTGTWKLTRKLDKLYTEHCFKKE